MTNPSARITARDFREWFKLKDDEYQELTEVMEDRTGLCFTPEKKRDVQLKLKERLPERPSIIGKRFPSAVKESREFFQNVVNALTVGESYFFRNRPHFDALVEHIMPQLINEARKTRRLCIWCAGCATGEEPYSIAIMIREHFPELSDWNVTITATDINTRFLELAEEGLYSSWSFRGVEEEIIWKYFSKEGASYRLHADIRRSVNFEWLNLAELPFVGRLPEPQYDLIMCRNVLIYFSFPFANEVVTAFSAVTHPGSFLMVGHSEAFPALSHLDAIYSNATYYYRYHHVPGERADRQSIAPGPTLSIPGIGVKTIVPKSPPPKPFLVDQGPRFQNSGAKALPLRENGRLRLLARGRAKQGLDISAELEQARQNVNLGMIEETFERLSALGSGPGKLDYRVHFLRSIVADQSSRVQEAVKSLKQAIFLKKDFVIGHFYLGVIQQREGEVKIAARSFRNARNLLKKLADDYLLEETEGLTAGRLKEIVEARCAEVQLG